jgi:N6-L-threonylcarbamoyladenine synthase
MIVLGIESSCDETSVAVVENGKKLLSNITATSLDIHAHYGGVVPEIAARSHVEAIMPVVAESLAVAFPDDNDPWSHIDAIAVTYGPGLGGSLLIGVLAARTLALMKHKPLYGVNHVTAHCYANFLTETTLDTYQLPERAPHFPLLAIIVSGGHTQLVLFKNYFEYDLLGQTNDDAIGEAFDKVAKIIGLPYPGGPNVSRVAKDGNKLAYKFPQAQMAQPYDFSFSGVKTAVLRTAQSVIGQDYTFPSFKIAPLLTDQQKADIAASFEYVAIKTIVDKACKAFDAFEPADVIIAGGVAANQELRKQLAERLPIEVRYTDPKLCTDNGAMIATMGCFMAQEGLATTDPLLLDPRPNLSM